MHLSSTDSPTFRRTFALIALVATGATTWAGGSPELIVMNSTNLAASRTALAAGDTTLIPAVDRVIAEADAALDEGPFTVMAKSVMPPVPTPAGTG